MLPATRHVRPQRIRLEHHRRLALFRRQPRDVLAADADRALVGNHEAGDRAQQRGLAAAGAAEQRDHLAALDAEAHAVEHARPAVGNGKVFDRKVRCHRLTSGKSRALPVQCDVSVYLNCDSGHAAAQKTGRSSSNYLYFNALGLKPTSWVARVALRGWCAARQRRDPKEGQDFGLEMVVERMSVTAPWPKCGAASRR